jgi:hypothetical protein
MSALGAAATGVAILASATLNYRYTFTMFGDGGIESLAYGAVAVVLDILKALAPIFIAARLKERDWFSAFGGVVILAIAIPWSFMCATGLAAQNRSDRAVPVENRQASFKEAKDDLARLESRLARLESARSVGEINAEIAGALRAAVRSGKQLATVGELSSDCAAPTWGTARACAAVARLRQELATAQTRDELEKSASEKKTIIAKLRADGAGEGRLADAQAQILARWLSDLQGWAVTVGSVQFGLAILLALVFEAVTTFGLSLSLGRHHLSGQKPEINQTETEDEDQDEAPSTVETFCKTQLKPAPGSKLSFRRAFEGYAAWCKADRHEALPREPFMAALRTAAQAQGLSVAGGIIHNVALATDDRKPAAA